MKQKIVFLNLIAVLTLLISSCKNDTIEVTVSEGTNELIGSNPKAIKPAMEKLLSGNWKIGTIPEKWDGNTSERIIETLLNLQIFN
jgi:hypothetical protein